MRRSLVPLLLGLTACVGGSPRQPGDANQPRPAWAERQPVEDRARAEPDPWSVDAELPRSGDPERPNVKVELTVLETRADRELWVRGAVAGTVVRGVVNVRAALAGAARSQRQRSQITSFIVVQEGRSAAIRVSEEARPYCGAWNELAVFVHDAGPSGVELSVEPRFGRSGGDVAAATTVRVAPGQALVIGGVDQQANVEQRGVLRHDERASRRQVLVLVQVEVLG